MFVISFKNYLVIFLFGLAYLYGILSPEHYSPSSHDFYINTVVFFICTIGLGLFFLRKEVKIYYSDLLWVIIFLIILIQPLVNNILYTDGLIFPLSIMIICFFLSIYTKNIDQSLIKKKLINFLCVIFVLGSFILYLTQLAHVFRLYNIVEFLGLPLQEKRFSGNLYQPNQTAFVYVLGILSIILLINDKPRYCWLGILYIVLISSGIVLTFSRTGLIMLFITVFVYNIYINYNHKISFLKLKFAYSAILGLIIGVLISTNLIVNEQLVQRTLHSLEDPRISLFKKSLYIIRDYPLFGIGWKNFASTNFDYYASLHWVGLADHSHSILTHLLAEFGLVLGGSIIVFFGFIFYEGLKKISDPLQFYLFIILLTFIIYSLLEFPLWDFRYLFIFVLFLGFFVRSEKHLFIVEKGFIFSIISLFLVIFSIYYLKEYRKIAYVDSILVDPNRSNSEKNININQLNNIIGFSAFKEQFIYRNIVADGFMLVESIALGERVTRYTPSSEFLIKQGRLLALNFQQEKSLYYFKLACKYEWNQECNLVQIQLKQFYQQDPKHFEYIYNNLKY